MIDYKITLIKNNVAGIMFENGEASKAFSDALLSFAGDAEKQMRFGEIVRQLYISKALSDEGDYETFKITALDIRFIVQTL